MNEILIEIPERLFLLQEAVQHLVEIPAWTSCLVSVVADGESMGAPLDPRAPPAWSSDAVRRARDQSSQTNQPLARHDGAGELRGKRGWGRLRKWKGLTCGTAL